MCAVEFCRTVWAFGRDPGSGANPWAPLIQGSDGSLYGTTFYGGSYNWGTVFRINRDGSGYAILHEFQYYDGSDGISPYGGLLQASDGALYGTASSGAIGNWGTVFKINPDGTGYATVHSFRETDGASPRAGLIQGSDGRLYGTTYQGGTSQMGTIFGLNLDGSGYATLHSFQTSGGDGFNPRAALVQGSDGALYGTTYLGGSANFGTIFRISPDGSGYSSLHSFQSSGGDGFSPQAALVQGSDGALYGTTLYGGGSSSQGVLFTIKLDGTGYAVLHSTKEGEGRSPNGPLVQGSDGALYGTAYGGDTGNLGTVFKVNADGSGFVLLHSFQGSDGSLPVAGLVQGSDGALYGTTRQGGAGYGVVFTIHPDGGGFAALHSFQCEEGLTPQARLFQSTTGALYGTTRFGGSAASGTIFKVNPDGSGYAILHSFQGPGGDGANPLCGLVQGSDGALYGTTYYGGSASLGTIFRMNPDGSDYSILRSFLNPGGDGHNPEGALVQGSDGALYGTTYDGGPFKIQPDGSGFTVLYQFGGSGEMVSAGLIQGSDGFFYGTTEFGGNYGTVFKIRPDGSDYAIIHAFQHSTSDGRLPIAGLVQSRDGLLCGTTSHGGSSDGGTIFKLNRDGSGFALLHSFPSFSGVGTAMLIQGSDGALYGTTPYGVYKIKPDGSAFASLHDFPSSGGEGYNALAGVIQGSNGMLYGTTSAGGPYGGGGVYALDLAASISATQGTPQMAKTGTTFATPLAAMVVDNTGQPISGIYVTFTAPANGASGTFQGYTAWSVITAANGVATAPPFKGNTLAGSYTVAATAPGLDLPASFNLTNVGPLSKFASSLSSPQANGVAFSGANTLTAQDRVGNTVTTFDASLVHVTITANAPLIGNVSGLGTGINNILNRATDFVSGVADLTALGMIYGGSLGTGTFTATSSTGKTGVSGSVTINGIGPGQPGKEMQVVMWLTIPKSVSIAWGAGTTGKTVGDVTPFDWTVQDATGSQLGHGETRVSNDANNSLAMNLENTSSTGTNARAFAAVTNSGGWNIGGAPATDTFAIKAQLGTNPQAALAAAVQELTGTGTLAKGADQPLVVTVMTPTDITRDAGVQKTIFVVLTATPE